MTYLNKITLINIVVFDDEIIIRSQKEEAAPLIIKSSLLKCIKICLEVWIYVCFTSLLSLPSSCNVKRIIVFAFIIHNSFCDCRITKPFRYQPHIIYGQRKMQ